MLLYACFFQVIFVIYANLVENNKNAVNVSQYPFDIVFTEVIKNISRVNNVLQDLINKYEQLQNVYKSQEDIDNDYTNTEVNYRFKTVNPKKEVSEKRSEFKKMNTDISKSNRYFGITQITWSDEKSISEESEIVTEETAKKSSMNVINNSINNILNQTLNTKPNVNIRERPILKEKLIIHPSEHVNAYWKPQILFETEFIDTYKNILPKTNPLADKKENTVESYNSFSSQDEISKSNSEEINKKYMSQSHEPLKNDSKQMIKKIIYTETFSPKSFWDDIISNKPINLKMESDVTNKELLFNHSNTLLRKESPGTAYEIATKDSKKKETKYTFSSIEDDKALIKDEFKTSVLRQAYGEACLKLVVRKCFKALQSALKLSCSSCKSTFKEKFKESSKTGCIQQFKDIPSNKDIIDKKNITYREDDKDFKDATRGGYLSVACQPNIEEPKPAILRNDTRVAEVSKYKNINILRDSFERACQQVSKEKCSSACKYALDKACDGKCTTSRKRIIKKNCRGQCKSIYKYGLSSKYSSSESTSSSGSMSSSSTEDTSISTD